MANAEERTFLVESYVPDLDDRIAASITSRLSGAVLELEKEGTALRWLRSFALVGEETFLHLVAATDVDHIVQLSQRAGLEYDHVVEVFVIESSPAARC